MLAGQVIRLQAAALVTAAVATPLAGQAPCTPMAGNGAAIDTASVPVGDARVSVCYAARTAEGRVFGYATQWAEGGWVVSYDSLWHTGVVIDAPVPVELAGIALEPGRYGLYAVPSSYEWTIIATAGVDGFVRGAPYEGAAREREVGRALARSSALAEHTDRMQVWGAASGSSSGDLVLAWGDRQVSIPIRAIASRGRLACELRGSPDRLAGRASPPDSVTFTLAGRSAKLCYGAPSARDRVIFGGILPYDDGWRLGANEPTVLHIPFAASIAGIDVPPGDYAILAVPSPREWTIVVNASTNQWGRATPLPSGASSSYTDAVRVREMGRALVPSEGIAELVERMRIRAEPSGARSVDLVVEWERTRVRIPVTVRP